MIVFSFAILSLSDIDLLRSVIALSFCLMRSALLLAILIIHLPLYMRKENPNSILSSGLLTFVFSLFTFKRNLPSVYFIMPVITRFAAVSLDKYILTSSAYLTKA